MTVNRGLSEWDLRIKLSIVKSVDFGTEVFVVRQARSVRNYRRCSSSGSRSSAADASRPICLPRGYSEVATLERQTPEKGAMTWATAQLCFAGFTRNTWRPPGSDCTLINP